MSDPTISFSQTGTGPEHILVMHDWNGDHQNYDPTIPYLDGEAFTYVFVDLRGFGKSREIAGDFTLAEIAADCLDVASMLGWQRFHIVGHSMTGMATQKIAADVPARIKSAVAICPLPATGSQLGDDDSAFLSSTIVDDDAFRRLMQFATGNRLSNRWADVKLGHNRDAISVDCRQAYLDMFAETNIVAVAQGLATPFLIVVGDRDPGLGESVMRESFLKWHANAELQVITNCGHYPMQECPPYLANVLETFLKQHCD